MFTAGASVGPYEVVGPLGTGGMGRVWRVRDTRLGREVAVKVLPEAFATDASRLSRFEREARLLAALNHPGIATVHGFERVDGVSMLVQELVEGPTLEERLRRGPLPMADALAIARQVAGALEVAHESGIIHRDVKPSNVKLLPDGRVKLLDFGLAKALTPDIPDSEVSLLSTDTSGTEPGAILGTTPYMSPEQTRGQAVDERTDIWSFGCVLFEMLAGRRAFDGPTKSDIIAAVLEREPDWSTLPASTPATVRSLLRRCLGKRPERRMRSLADARLELEDPGVGPPENGAAIDPRQFPRRLRWLAALAGAGIVATVWFAPRPAPRAPVPPRRFQIVIPPTTPLNVRPYAFETIAITPDGKSLVFVSQAGDRHSQLFVRRLDGLAVTPIPGTEDGLSPLGFSPDGQWILFNAEGKLKKVLLEGGPAITVADAPNMRGASWGDDGTIVFSAERKSGLSRVPAEGGTPRPVTTIKGEGFGHRWPQMLPGSRAALFSVLGIGGRTSQSRIEAVELATGRRTIVLEGGVFGRYVPTGHLVYGSGGRLYAAPFDVERLKVNGPAVAVVDDVRMSARGAGDASFVFSNQGLLAYLTPSFRPGTAGLVWMDRLGRAQRVLGERRTYCSGGWGLGAGVRLSPDGKHLVVPIIGENVEDIDLWSCDLQQAVWKRLTSKGGGLFAAWRPGEPTLALSSDEEGPLNIFGMWTDGSPVVRLTSATEGQVVTGWSPDGSTIAFTQLDSTGGADAWVLPVRGDGHAREILATTEQEGGTVFSPDGRWIAYSAGGIGGGTHVFVRPYPLEGTKNWRVSSGEGLNPMWSPTGRELFYRTEEGDLVAVPVVTNGGFQAGKPHVLFRQTKVARSLLYLPAPYDVTRDGQRFLMVLEDEQPDDTPQIVVVPDWFEELKAKSPLTLH